MFSLLEIPFGFRNVGTWNQVPVRSEEEIIRIVNKHLGFRHIGISMCAYLDDESYLLFLPFDFDDEKNLRIPWIDGKRLFNYCVDEGLRCWLIYSGNRGFHVLIKTIPKVYSKRQIKASQSYFIDELELKSFDYQIHGDVVRLMRLPWTFNPKKTWCRILAFNNGRELNLDEIHKGIPEDKYRQRSYKETYNYEKPCIEFLIKEKAYWIKEKGRFEPSEPIRITWATMRLWRGDSIDDIIKEGKSYGWDDFSENYIRKKLEYLDGREYTPYGCPKLKEMGYCIRDVYCKWRNNIEEDMKDVGII